MKTNTLWCRRNPCARHSVCLKSLHPEYNSKMHSSPLHHAFQGECCAKYSLHFGRGLILHIRLSFFRFTDGTVCLHVAIKEWITVFVVM